MLCVIFGSDTPRECVSGYSGASVELKLLYVCVLWVYMAARWPTRLRCLFFIFYPSFAFTAQCLHTQDASDRSSEGRRSPDRPLVRRNAWEHWTILRKEIILRFLLCLKNSLPFLVQVLIVVFSVCPHGSSHSSIGSSSMWESFHLVDWAHFSGSTLRWVWNDSVRLTDIVLVCAVQHTQHVFLVQSY